MIHKMLALYEYIPQDIIASQFSEYGLRLESVGNEVKVLVLNFKSTNRISYEGLSVMDYDLHKNTDQYFLRNVPGNAVSPFPTIYVSMDGVSGSTTDEVCSAKDFGKLIRILQNNLKYNPDLKALIDVIKSNAICIAEDIVGSISSPKTIYVLTLRIDDEFVADSVFFRSMLEHVREELLESFFTLKKQRTIGRNQVCSMCEQRKDEVWGYVSIFNFFTAKTELATIAGGFEPKNAHKIYPVCPQCANKLNKLKPIIDKYFSYRFCGLDYLIIPEIMGINKAEALKEIVEIFFDAKLRAEEGKTGIGTLTLGKRKKLVDSQTQDVFDILASTGNYANYTMLFYKTSNSEFKILASIENVFPYHFQNVFEAKAKAESHAIFRQQSGFKKKEKVDLEFTFSILKEYFPINSKMEGDFSKQFLELVRNTFMQRHIDDDFLIGRLISVIQKRFVEESFFMPATRKAFLILCFYNYLGLVKANTTSPQEVKMSGKYDSFF